MKANLANSQCWELEMWGTLAIIYGGRIGRRRRTIIGAAGRVGGACRVVARWYGRICRNARRVLRGAEDENKNEKLIKSSEVIQLYQIHGRIAWARRAVIWTLRIAQTGRVVAWRRGRIARDRRTVRRARRRIRRTRRRHRWARRCVGRRGRRIRWRYSRTGNVRTHSRARWSRTA